MKKYLIILLLLLNLTLYSQEKYKVYNNNISIKINKVLVDSSYITSTNLYFTIKNKKNQDIKYVMIISQKDTMLLENVDGKSKKDFKFFIQRNVDVLDLIIEKIVYKDNTIKIFNDPIETKNWDFVYVLISIGMLMSLVF